MPRPLITLPTSRVRARPRRKNGRSRLMCASTTISSTPGCRASRARRGACSPLLLRWKGADAEAHPCKATLAKMCNVTVPTIERALKSWIELGLIESRAWFYPDSGRQGANRYFFLATPHNLNPLSPFLKKRGGGVSKPRSLNKATIRRQLHTNKTAQALQLLLWVKINFLNLLEESAENSENLTPAQSGCSRRTGRAGRAQSARRNVWRSPICAAPSSKSSVCGRRWGAGAACPTPAAGSIAR